MNCGSVGELTFSPAPSNRDALRPALPPVNLRRGSNSKRGGGVDALFLGVSALCGVVCFLASIWDHRFGAPSQMRFHAGLCRMRSMTNQSSLTQQNKSDAGGELAIWWQSETRAPAALCTAHLSVASTPRRPSPIQSPQRARSSCQIDWLPASIDCGALSFHSGWCTPNWFNAPAVRLSQRTPGFFDNYTVHKILNLIQSPLGVSLVARLGVCQ